MSECENGQPGLSTDEPPPVVQEYGLSKGKRGAVNDGYAPENVDQVWADLCSPRKIRRDQAVDFLLYSASQGWYDTEVTERIAQFVAIELKKTPWAARTVIDMLAVAATYARECSIASLSNQDAIELVGFPGAEKVLDICMAYAVSERFQNEDWNALAKKLAEGGLSSATLSHPGQLSVALELLTACADHGACSNVPLERVLKHVLNGGKLTAELMRAMEAYVTQGQTSSPIHEVCIRALEKPSLYQLRCMKVLLNQGVQNYGQKGDVQVIRMFLDRQGELRQCALQLLLSYAHQGHVDGRLLSKLSKFLDEEDPALVSTAAMTLGRYAHEGAADIRLLSKVVAREASSAGMVKAYAEMIFYYSEKDMVDLDLFDFCVRNFPVAIDALGADKSDLVSHDPNYIMYKLEPVRTMALALYNYSGLGLMREDMLPILVEMVLLRNAAVQSVAIDTLYNYAISGITSEDVLDCAFDLVCSEAIEEDDGEEELEEKDNSLLSRAVQIVTVCAQKGVMFPYVPIMLSKLLESDDEVVREYSAWGLLYYAEAAYLETRTMGPLAKRMLDPDEDSDTREYCARALLTYMKHGFVNMELLTGIRAMEGQGRDLELLACNLVWGYAKKGLFSPQSETFLRIELRNENGKVRMMAKDALKVYESRRTSRR